MFCLHSKNKEKQKIIILGRKTYKTILDDRDARYDGHYTLAQAIKEKEFLEAMPAEQQFWHGEIKIVDL